MISWAVCCSGGVFSVAVFGTGRVISVAVVYLDVDVMLSILYQAHVGVVDGMLVSLHTSRPARTAPHHLQTNRQTYMLSSSNILI